MNELQNINGNNDVQQFRSMWNDKDLLGTAYSAAKYLAASALVPTTYQGKPENVLIAIDISNRTGLSPIAVMQELYIVQGKPAWSGKMSVALINACGRFTPIKYIFIGEVGGDDYGCYASATERATGETLYGPQVSIQMAKDEGWYNKNGSKWKTIPELMLQYRAGAFFARVYCPEMLLGISMADEITDVYGTDAGDKKTKIIFNNTTNSAIETTPPETDNSDED